MAKRLRSLLIFPLLIAGCSILGGLYGPALAGSSSASGSSEDEINASIKTFTKVYSLVEQNAAETVSPDKAIYKGAIPGMLHTLDPHSSFFDPRDFQLLREEQKGHYFGVGMQIGPSRTGSGRTICIAPFPGSPAYKAGIRPGDAIIAVGDKNTEKMTLTEIADLLKGPRGTQVKVTIARDGTEKPIVFELTRDEIPRKTVQDAMWLKRDAGIAYLDIESFNENTSQEVNEALRKLPESEIKGLVLDLRGNPGGLLNEGVAVADRWLQKGQLIVSHHGRASSEKEYKARIGDQGRDYPIVVLVDRYSASAAEIVTGALQDHDRAWVLGDQTFGKGLVQTVYPLNENSGLALTTAKYYTPSGRLIQRDYSGVSFLDYYYHRGTEKNAQDAKMTDSGRAVYGGNGITPDEKYTGPKLDRFQTELIRKWAFFNFTSRYLGQHGTNLPKNWVPSQDVMNDFHQYLLNDAKVSFTEAEFAQDNDWMKQQLRREVYNSAFSMDDARRFGIETDPEIAKAIDAMPKAKALLDTAKRVLAQRVANNGR